jgi:hypothetical protein
MSSVLELGRVAALAQDAIMRIGQREIVATVAIDRPRLAFAGQASGAWGEPDPGLRNRSLRT